MKLIKEMFTAISVFTPDEVSLGEVLLCQVKIISVWRVKCLLPHSYKCAPDKVSELSSVKPFTIHQLSVHDFPCLSEKRKMHGVSGCTVYREQHSIGMHGISWLTVIYNW